jgi:hypothetical protein
MKPTNGLVAFLDILGYQNFIDNNSVEKAVDILAEVFNGLKDAVIEDYRNSWIKQASESNKRFEDVTIQTLSDSIILHFPIEGKNFPMRDWLTLLQTARVIQRRLFDNGFPSRGAIASGKYFFRDGFLVGRPFMDAYRLSQSLEFVSIAMTPEAFTRFKTDSKFAKSDWVRFPGGVEFLAPVKGNREERLYCLCPLRKNEIGTEACKNLAALVQRSFWRHQKDVPATVDVKVSNTIKFWTYWICRKEESLQ